MTSEAGLGRERLGALGTFELGAAFCFHIQNVVILHRPCYV
jgi:hypothetical protein